MMDAGLKTSADNDIERTKKQTNLLKSLRKPYGSASPG
jgi:hypothetical protein